MADATRSGRMPAPGRWLWRPLWPPAQAVARALFSLEVEGRELLPDPPFVVAANHLSHLDPPLLAVAVVRPVRFLAVDELYGTHPALDAVLRTFGAIPLSRTRVPLGAMKAALATLAEGGIVGLFPEGRRVRAWGDEPPRRGAGWLSARAGVPLVPAAIRGTDAAYGVGAERITRAPVSIAFGPPIRSGTPDERIEAWRRWMDARLSAPDGHGAT